MQSKHSAISGFICLYIVQFVFLLIYWVYVRYDQELLPADDKLPAKDAGKVVHASKYPHFQDIHVMIFVGFGFLMTFLRKYGYSATGFNLFLASLVIQWALIVKGFFKLKDGSILINLESIIDADIAAAVPLISMGALLGRTTPIQLLLMGLIETLLFATNEYIQLDLVKIADVGGSITVHAFGAYFGLAVSFILRPKKNENHAGENECASYVSDIFAMIGTLFLWIFWPSFNSVLVDGADQERAIVNTYLSLAAATVTALIMSALVSHGNKFDMVHVQNSTLAGGVAVGSVCNLLIGPHGAILIGITSGAISVLGYRFVTPFLTSKLRIHDTCGVNNLHGMPGVISALFSAVYACLAKKETYKSTLYEIFPAMMNATEAMHANETEHIIGGFGRTAVQQGGYQVLGITITVAIAIVGGLVTGYLLQLPGLRRLSKESHHEDEPYWEVPEKDQYCVFELGSNKPDE